MKTLFFSLSIIVISHCQAQILAVKEAETLFAKKRYSGVWNYYLNQLKKDSLNTLLNLKMGVCYLNSRSQKEKSIKFFKQALKRNDLGKQKQAYTYKLLGDAYYHVSDFKQAIINYEKYRNMVHDGKAETTGDISKEIEMCKMANDLKELKAITTSLTENINGGKKHKKNLYAYHESSLSLTQQSSISLPLKKNTASTNSLDKIYFEEIQHVGNYTLKKDQKKTDTTENRMETTIATSIDGQIILLYRDDNGTGNLYSSSLHGNEWMQPELLSQNIINKNWEPNEFVSTDGNELFFSCEREGGFGGEDIYKCRRLSNGEWGKAVNMGSMINTKYDEEAPFLYPDGHTLYFSSNRNRKNNFFDNFLSTFSDSAGWANPLNVGYPVYNKIENPTTDTVSANINSAFKDNYIATFFNTNKIPVTVLKGTIIDKDGNTPSYVEITIANNMTGEITAIYHPSAKTGNYSFILPSRQNQNITYEAEGFIFHSENIDLGRDPNIYKLNKIITLQQIAEGTKIKLNNIFFEAGKSSLSPASDIELNKLTSFFIHNPLAQVEFAAYINKKSDNEYIKQTKEKIQSLINFLSEKGIDKKNIKSAVYKIKKNKEKQSESTKDEYNLEKLELKIIALK